MRIIAGEFRSRPIQSVPGTDVRPTPDRLRESLFSILMPVIDEAVFIDAYAGSGAVGIEALSRGARRAIFIEKNSKALDVLRDNLNTLKLNPRANVIRAKVAQVLANYPADIIFIDPPYTAPDEYEAALLAAKAPLVIAQHSTRHKLDDSYGDLVRYRIVKQGDNSLSFYQPADKLARNLQETATETE